MAQCVRPRRQWYRGSERTFTEPSAPSLWDVRDFRCGKCAPCLIARAGAQAVRLTHEGYSHAESTSLCLTYAPAFLPPDGSLRVSDWSRFLNSLRKRIERRGGPKLSFDVVGEYSPPPELRPHYHAALFGYWPPDAVRLEESSRSGNVEYRSDEIDELWGKGRATFQSWDHGAASYIAGHNSGKLMRSKDHGYVRNGFGQVIGKREPEFHRSSRKSAPGRRFFEEHGEQALLNGFVVAKDQPVALPAYYMKRAKVTFPELAELHQAERKAKALEAAAKDGPPLESVEYCAEQKIARGGRKNGLG